MHPRCDSVYEASAARMSRTSISENVQNKQNTKRITKNRKDFFYFRKNNQRVTAQSVSERTIRALKNLAAKGIVRIVHGNLQRTPHNILSAEVIQSIVRFLKTLPQPAAPPGYPGPPPVYLSASRKK